MKTYEKCASAIFTDLVEVELDEFSDEQTSRLHLTYLRWETIRLDRLSFPFLSFISIQRPWSMMHLVLVHKLIRLWTCKEGTQRADIPEISNSNNLSMSIFQKAYLRLNIDVEHSNLNPIQCSVHRVSQTKQQYNSLLFIAIKVDHNWKIYNSNGVAELNHVASPLPSCLLSILASPVSMSVVQCARCLLWL